MDNTLKLPTHVRMRSFCLYMGISIALMIQITTSKWPLEASESDVYTLGAFRAGAQKAKDKCFPPNVRTHVVINEEFPTGLRKPSVRTLDIVAKNSFGKLTTTKQTGDQIVQCKNDRYAFQLVLGKNGLPNTLVYLEELRSAGSDKIKELDKAIRDVSTIVFAPWVHLGTYLWDVPDNPKYEIRKISRDDTLADGLARIDVVYHRTRTQQDREVKESFEQYWLCDPQHEWRLREIGAVSPSGVVLAKHVLDFGQPDDLCPTTFVCNSYDETGQQVNLRDIKYDNSDKTEIDTSEFYLSAYGLREPVFSRRLSPSTIYFLLGIGLLIAAAVIRKFIALRAAPPVE
jgi:hypothetical protein